MKLWFVLLLLVSLVYAHVMPRGVSVSEFSGKVQISGQRAKLFFMSPGGSKGEINDYIKKRHEVLEKLAKQEPNKELHAQLSFNGYLSADQMVKFVNENKVDTISLNIGWKEAGGGHDLKQGESIETAIKLVALHQKELLADLQADANASAESLRKSRGTDAQMQAEFVFQKMIDEQTAVFLTKGVTFYGVRVAGKAKQLHEITGYTKGIRLVDPLWGGSVEEEVADLYSVTKIAIPLKPENDNFLPQIIRDQK